MDSLFEKAASQLGGCITADQLKVVTAVLGAYPCSVLIRHLRQPAYKHGLSVLFTTFIMTSVLHMWAGLAHIMGISLFSYLFMKYYHGRQGPWINFFIVMASMAACHIDRQIKGIEGDTELDYSGALMVVTIKLSAFGFNIRDGRGDRNDPRLTDHHRRMKIEVFPTLLQFFGWVFFFGGFLAGPACEYMDYLRFIHLRIEDTGITKPPASAPPVSTWKPTAVILIKVALGLGALATVLAPFPYKAALEPSWLAMPFLQRLGFLALCGFTTRIKYYSIWYLSEGACVLAGLGFNGYDDQGEARWDRLTNVDVMELETAQSFTRLTIVWNKGANRWLRHYVYTRVLSPDNKPNLVSFLVTYVVASSWHGFHPGYYFFFFVSSAFQMLGRYYRRFVRPLTMTPDGKRPLRFRKACYDIIGWLVNHSALGTIVMTFDILHLSHIMYIYRHVYYLPFVELAVGSILLFPCIPYLKAWQKQRQSKTTEIVEKDSVEDLLVGDRPKTD